MGMERRSKQSNYQISVFTIYSEYSWVLDYVINQFNLLHEVTWKSERGGYPEKAWIWKQSFTVKKLKQNIVDFMKCLAQFSDINFIEYFYTL